MDETGVRGEEGKGGKEDLKKKGGWVASFWCAATKWVATPLGPVRECGGPVACDGFGRFQDGEGGSWT